MSSQKSEVLNVLFHFRNRLDVPSPPSPSLHFRREIRPCIRVLPRSYTRAPCGSTRRSPTFLRLHAQLPLLILIETEQPRRIHMHYLFHGLLLTNHNSTSSPLLQFSPEETTSRRLAPVFRGFISHHAANASVFTSSRAVQQCSCSSRFRFSSSSLNNFWQLSFQNPLYA